MNTHVGESHRPPGTRPPRAAAVLLAVALLAPAAARGQESRWSYDQDLHLTWEFDDNVNEAVGGSLPLSQDPVRAQVGKLAYRGDLEWGGGQQRLSLAYHGGFKRHFGVGRAEEGEPADPNAEIIEEVPSQLISEGSLSYLRRLTDDFAVSARVGIKDRRWTEDGFFFVNEDAFLRQSTGVSAIVNLDPVLPGRPARLEIGVRTSDVEFKNLDQFFGNHVLGGQVLLTKEYGAGVQTTWSYSYDRVRFPGRGALTPEDENPGLVILGVNRDRQEDRVHDLGMEVEWYGGVGIVAEYRYRYNDSNSFGFSWYSHNLGLQVLRQLPWGMFLQAYGRLEFRSFTEPVPSITFGSLDIGEAENNVLLLRLVKDITPSYAVEARYARHRNESITLNDFYSKNIYAVGVTYRP